MVLTIWKNLDVPKLRLFEAVERRTIFQSILESEVHLGLDGPNSPLAVVVLPLCDPLEGIAIVLA